MKVSDEKTKPEPDSLVRGADLDLYPWGSVADLGCLSRIPDPDFYPSRIPDPKTAIKERGEKN